VVQVKHACHSFLARGVTLVQSVQNVAAASGAATEIQVTDAKYGLIQTTSRFRNLGLAWCDSRNTKSLSMTLPWSRVLKKRRKRMSSLDAA